MDCDVDADACFLVADDDDTVAFMVARIFLVMEGEGLGLCGSGLACVGLSDPFAGIGNGDLVRDVTLDVDNEVSAFHRYFEGGGVGLEYHVERLVDGNLVCQTFILADNIDDCLSFFVRIVLTDD